MYDNSDDCASFPEIKLQKAFLFRDQHIEMAKNRCLKLVKKGDKDAEVRTFAFMRANAQIKCATRRR